MKTLILTTLFLLIQTIPSPALDAAPWRWSTDLPMHLTPRLPASHRTAADADAFFKKAQGAPPEILALVALLGSPDTFSGQFMKSRTHASSNDIPTGGTLRFLLGDDGELLVVTTNFKNATLAFRFDQTGATLLYK